MAETPGLPVSEIEYGDRGIQTMVCTGKVPVDEAQRAIAANWVEACQKYGLMPAR